MFVIMSLQSLVRTSGGLKRVLVRISRGCCTDDSASRHSVSSAAEQARMITNASHLTTTESAAYFFAHRRPPSGFKWRVSLSSEVYG